MFGLPSTMASTCFNAMDCLMNCFRFWAPHRRLSPPPWPDGLQPRSQQLCLFRRALRVKANKVVLGGDGGEVWLLERISRSEHRAPDTPEYSPRSNMTR